jgi:hypothetical protein
MIAAGIRVIAGNGRQEGVAIECELLMAHQFEHGIDRAAGGHHRGGGDLIHLRDCRLRMGAHGKSRCGDDFRVGAFVNGHDLFAGVRPVVIGHQAFEAAAQFAIHGVPEFHPDFGLPDRGLPCFSLRTDAGQQHQRRGEHQPHARDALGPVG